MVLALLREDDMHPYEMIRLMRHRHDDRIVSVTNGTMYHTVARLEKQGLLAEVGVDRDGNRPERTTYALTDAGHAAVVEWVRRELPAIDRPAQFRVALAEAHNLPREEAIALLTPDGSTGEIAGPATEGQGARQGRSRRAASSRSTRGRPARRRTRLARRLLVRSTDLLNDANAIPTDRYLAQERPHGNDRTLARVPSARARAHTPIRPGAARGPPSGRSSSGSS
jgi:DNA-binding PadR family transcriptional regulator